jgi:hypothetical protein
MSVPTIGDPAGVGEPAPAAVLAEAVVHHEGGRVGVRVLTTH